MPPQRPAAKRKATKTMHGSKKKQKTTCDHLSATTSAQPQSRKPGKKPAGLQAKDVSASHSTQKKRSANLSWFLRVYKGLDDWHIPIFKTTARVTGAKHVLYPGSDKHLSASLTFPNVVYVDFNLKLEPVFRDELVLNWIKENKTYTQEPKIKFLCKNFDTTFEKEGSFDLLISACAGIVSTSCAKYLKKGGHFLVSDSHFDARMTYINRDFKVIGVFDKGSGKLDTDAKELENHFHTTDGKSITRAQVDESIMTSRAKRSFKLKKEAMFYLFKKVK